MTYIVYHRTTTPHSGAVRFKKVRTFNSAIGLGDRHKLSLQDRDRTVKALALETARDLGVTDGEFLVRYTYGSDEFQAHIHVSVPPVKATAMII